MTFHEMPISNFLLNHIVQLRGIITIRLFKGENGYEHIPMNG